MLLPPQRGPQGNSIRLVLATTTMNICELWQLIGIVSYYHDIMWIQCSEVFSPWSKLTSKTAKWHWTEVEQNAFEMMKKIISWETLLAYPDFTKPFTIHTGWCKSSTIRSSHFTRQSSNCFLLMMQVEPSTNMIYSHWMWIVINSWNLKEFHNILLGQHIKVYTDHQQSLTYVNFNTECVMHWRLIIEEYSPELIYLKYGPDQYFCWCSK